MIGLGTGSRLLRLHAPDRECWPCGSCTSPHSLCSCGGRIRSEEPDVERPPRKSVREWIESLPRLDFWLLLLNAVFAAAYLWGFLTTRRV